MSEQTPPPAAPTPTEQAAEAAAIRRRWITLGEVLAVVAVLISALTLWNSYAERRANEADRITAEREADRKAGTLSLRATVSRDGKRMTLAPVRGDQVIQAQTIAFPKALDMTAQATTGDPRIEAAWLADALRSAREAAGRKGKTHGEARLPVSIATDYLIDGRPAKDVAIYDVGYTLNGKLFGGSVARLKGLALIEHSDAQHVAARLDARWRAINPAR